MKLNFLNDRRFKHGSLATIITVIFIAVIVLVNVVASLLLQRYPLTIDLSSEGRFELTQESVDYVKSIDMPIDIYVLADEQTYKNSSELYRQAYEIIMNYGKYSDKINIEFVDTVKNPNFVKQYPDENLSANNIFIKTDLRSKIVTTSSLFSQTQSQITGEYAYSSKAEQSMTSALMYVTDQNPITVNLLTGLSNTDVSGYITLLESNNYSVTEKNILTEEIDPEASFVILPQPASDITAEQATMLSDYLDNNGRFGRTMMFIASPQVEVGPVLKAFLADWGMEIGNETIIETDGNYAISNLFTFLNEVVDEDLETAMDTTQSVVTTNARPINILFDTNGNRTVKTLLQSHASSVLLPVDYDETFDISAQEQKAYPTAAMCTRLKYDQTTALTSNVVVISASSMLNGSYLELSAFANSNAMVSITNSFAEKKESVKILPVTFDNNLITVSNGQIMANIVVFVILIPLGVLVCGLVIWLRRRHL